MAWTSLAVTVRKWNCSEIGWFSGTNSVGLKSSALYGTPGTTFPVLFVTDLKLVMTCVQFDQVQTGTQVNARQSQFD